MKSQVAGPVQFVPVKTGLAERVAARSHKQDYSSEALFSLGGSDQAHELSRSTRHTESHGRVSVKVSDSALREGREDRDEIRLRTRYSAPHSPRRLNLTSSSSFACSSTIRRR